VRKALLYKGFRKVFPHRFYTFPPFVNKWGQASQLHKIESFDSGKFDE